MHEKLSLCWIFGLFLYFFSSCISGRRELIEFSDVVTIKCKNYDFHGITITGHTCYFEMHGTKKPNDFYRTVCK